MLMFKNNYVIAFTACVSVYLLLNFPLVPITVSGGRSAQ